MGQTPKLSVSISTKLGFELQYLIAFAVATYVKLGNKSNKDAEVVDGLNVGDLIVLEGANIVEDSQRVKLIK